MATGFGRPLSKREPAPLGPGWEAVPCLVVGFDGADIVLAFKAQPLEGLPDNGISFLLIEAEGRLHALKAFVRPGTGENEYVATLLDPFRLGQRRNFSRAPLVLP